MFTKSGQNERLASKSQSQTFYKMYLLSVEQVDKYIGHEMGPGVTNSDP